MLAGDGLLVRLRPPGGRLDIDAIRGVARLADRFGNGTLELTSRANLQLRGATDDTYPALVDGLRALGLVDEDIVRESRRNLLVSPLYRCDDDTSTLVAAFEHALARSTLPALPGKFGFAIDCAAVPCLRGASADIRLERAGGGLLVRADGDRRGRLVGPAEAPAAMLDLARWFVASGGGASGRRRMATHLAAGATPPAAWRTAFATADTAPPPEPGPVAAGFLLGLPLGRMSASMFAELAALGAIRLTPWRLLLVEGLGTAPEATPLVTREDDPLRRVVACSGAPACQRAEQPVHALARRLAASVPEGRILHVSGCAKGCAYGRPADVVLTGTSSGFTVGIDAVAGTTHPASAWPSWLDAARATVDAA